MIIKVWRVCPADAGACAYDGLGALKEFGRWHYKGTRITYASSSLALASLEFFVGLENGKPSEPLVAVPGEIPADLVERLDESILPEGWKRTPAPEKSKQIGTDWVNSGRGAVLAVPSEIVPHESNYLLNPVHPDYWRIAILAAEPFEYDKRMWKC